MLTKEQVQERKKFIGGSDAAAVLGLSRWATPLSVWCQKTGQLPDEDKSDVLAIEVGNELEDLVCRLFTKRTGKKVHRVTEAKFHPKYPFIGAHIDRRVVGEDSILEAKTCSGWKAKEWEGEDIPREYLVQAMHYLAVTGGQVAYVACLIGGNQKFVWKPVLRDEQLIRDILDREVAFWTKYVEPKVMPCEVKAQDADTLYKLFPQEEVGKEIELTDEATRIIESIKSLKADAVKLDDTIGQQENELKLLMGDAERATNGLWTVTWRRQTRRGLDTDKIKAELPDLFKTHGKETQSRVLKIVKSKKS